MLLLKTNKNKTYLKRKDRRKLSRLINIALDREDLVYKRVYIGDLIYTYFIIQSLTENGVFGNDELHTISHYLKRINKIRFKRIVNKEIEKNRSTVYSVFLEYLNVFGGL